MPDKIANHFVLADGSVARYEYDGLINAPKSFVEVFSDSVSKTGTYIQRDYFPYPFKQGKQYIIYISFSHIEPSDSNTGLSVRTMSAEDTSSVVDNISGSLPPAQTKAKGYRWSYIPSAGNAFYLNVYTNIKPDSSLSYTLTIYENEVEAVAQKASDLSTLVLDQYSVQLAHYVYDKIPSGNDSRAYVPCHIKAGNTYYIKFILDELSPRNGALLRTSTGRPDTVKETIGAGYMKVPSTYEFVFTATQDANFFYVYTSQVKDTNIKYSLDVFVSNSNHFDGSYGYAGEHINLQEYTYNIGTLMQTNNPYSVGYQGLAVYDNKLYRLFNGGYCAVYDLNGANGASRTAIASFTLGSADSTNHAGVANFSTEIASGQTIPLLYVSGGSATMPATCFVEQISVSGSTYSSTLVQTITLDQTGFTDAGLLQFFPWGKWCPYGNHLYLVSSLTRADGSTDRRRNKYVVTKFDLPSTSSDVTLTATDVVEQFTLPYVEEFAQGITIYNGKLFQVFGYPTGGFPAQIVVSSLPAHAPMATLDISTTSISLEELEDCAVYNNQLVVGATSNNVYAIEFC